MEKAIAEQPTYVLFNGAEGALTGDRAIIAKTGETVRLYVGGAANVYGVRGPHGLVWKWVNDYNAPQVNLDSRSQEDANKLKFCGAGAINLKDRENYAVLMRMALSSSLDATASTSSLGFRCVRPASP